MRRPKVKTILGQLGVTGNAAESLTAEFIDKGFMKQVADDGLLRQITRRGTVALTIYK
jgi:hypothetical protein